MKGVRTLFPFTSWCWMLLGTSFVLHGGLALAVDFKGEAFVLEQLSAPPWILRTILLIWETAAPCAFLVSAVIRYFIWPMVLYKGTGDTSGLKHPRMIMPHNFNSLFVLTEMALLGGLPVRLSEMYLGPIYGVIYVLIAWNLTHFWTEKESGPHFIYFFLDTTRGLATTGALVALTTVLTLFYVILSSAKGGLDYLPIYFEAKDSIGLLFCHVVFVLGIASLVMRFRD